ASRQTANASSWSWTGMKQVETVRFMRVTLGPARRGCLSISDRSQVQAGEAGRDGGDFVVVAPPVGAWARPHQLGEARAEGPEGCTSDRKADFRHRHVAAPQERLGALDAPGHEVAIRRFPKGLAE